MQSPAVRINLREMLFKWYIYPDTKLKFNRCEGTSTYLQPRFTIKPFEKDPRRIYNALKYLIIYAGLLEKTYLDKFTTHFFI